ncbi:potassium channel family protein [Shimia sp. W99]
MQKSAGPLVWMDHHRWTILLGLLVVLVAIGGLEGHFNGLERVSQIGMSVLFLGVVGAIERNTWLRAVMMLPVAVWMALMLANSLWPGNRIDVLLTGVAAVLWAGSMLIGFRQLFVSAHSEYERLASGVFSYLLMAVIWGMIYWRIEAVAPGSFNLPDGVSGAQQGPFLYFSMITMTTVGYGEITPAAELPRMLTGLQAIVGTMFVAIFIGRSVGRLT